MVGLVYADPAQQANVVETISSVVPPMRDLMEAVLSEAARGAGPVSIIGAVVLVWSTSRFVVAFQGAIAAVMGGDRRRGFIASNVISLGAVVLLVVALLATTVIAGVLDFLVAGSQAGVMKVVGDALASALSLLPIVVTIGAVIAVYRLVPIPSPPWGAVVVPSAAVGIAIWALGRLFVYVAPRLIGAAAFLGTLATVFAALAWLGLSFQALLFGAAWVRERAPLETIEQGRAPGL